ncbi:hypothetical protein ACHAW6_007555 [Cyclotella cf. meneghiniana]
MPSSTWITLGIIGCINYYQGMWPSHAHILKPLTDHSGLKKCAPIHRTLDVKTSFNKMYTLMAAGALAAYLNHNKRFDVYTDASDINKLQDQLVVNFSHKLSKSQKNYKVMEKEMLAIVATPDKCQSRHLGSNIHVFNNHKT